MVDRNVGGAGDSIDDDCEGGGDNGDDGSGGDDGDRRGGDSGGGDGGGEGVGGNGGNNGDGHGAGGESGNDIKNDVIKAVTKAFILDDINGLHHNFLSILEYGKELYCKGDSMLQEQWPTSWQGALHLLKETGYSEPTNLFK